MPPRFEPPPPPPQPPTVVDWGAPGAPPPVPPQPAGAHDYPAGPAFSAGSASLPPPGSPVPISGPLDPGGSWGPPGPGPQPMPRRAGGGSRMPLVLVSVIAGLLLVVGGVMTYLWVSASSELDDTRIELTGEVDQLNGTVGERDTEIDRLNDELQQAQDELADAQTALEGTENQVDILEEEKDTIRACLVLFGEADAAIQAGDDAQAEAILEEAEPVCEEANRALGF
jgi:hypothetical protein